MAIEGLTSVSDVLKNDFTKGRMSKHPKRLKTGFNKLDDLLGGGLAPGLAILGASPGLGKSTFALQIACRIAHMEERNVLYFSFEMSTEGISAKCLTRYMFEKNGKSHSDDELKAKETPNDLITSDEIMTLGQEAYKEKWEDEWKEKWRILDKYTKDASEEHKRLLVILS